MSGQFGQAAQRLCGLAARALGWQPHEFWAATPIELATALSPPAGEAEGVAREELNKLMELDNGDTWLRPD